MIELHGLQSGVRTLLSEDFRTGKVAKIEIGGHLFLRPLGREVRLEPLKEVIKEAMRRFADNREKSDAWLAPRVHATLRLTRREAADKRIWAYLTIQEESGYVRWRFEKENRVIPIERFVGEETRNALSRLWWAGELTRNGKEYRSESELLRALRLYASWLPMDSLHHRPGSLAIIRFLNNFNQSKGVTDEESRRFSRELNLCLATHCLDALTANPDPDAEAMRQWTRQTPDPTLMLDQLPEGPDDAPVQEDEIQRVYDLLTALADKVGLAGAKREPRKTD